MGFPEGDPSIRASEHPSIRASERLPAHTFSGICRSFASPIPAVAYSSLVMLATNFVIMVFVSILQHHAVDGVSAPSDFPNELVIEEYFGPSHLIAYVSSVSDVSDSPPISLALIEAGYGAYDIAQADLPGHTHSVPFSDRWQVAGVLTTPTGQCSMLGIRSGSQLILSASEYLLGEQPSGQSWDETLKSLFALHDPTNERVFPQGVTVPADDGRSIRLCLTAEELGELGIGPGSLSKFLRGGDTEGASLESDVWLSKVESGYQHCMQSIRVPSPDSDESLTVALLSVRPAIRRMEGHVPPCWPWNNRLSASNDLWQLEQAGIPWWEPDPSVVDVAKFDRVMKEINGPDMTLSELQGCLAELYGSLSEAVILTCRLPERTIFPHVLRVNPEGDPILYGVGFFHPTAPSDDRVLLRVYSEFTMPNDADDWTRTHWRLADPRAPGGYSESLSPLVIRHAPSSN